VYGVLYPLTFLVALAAHSREAQEPNLEEWDNTFSLVAHDPATGAVGGAVSTARLPVVSIQFDRICQ
jgi:hypothetical protein